MALNTKQFIYIGIAVILMVIMLGFFNHRKDLVIKELNDKIGQLENDIEVINDELNYSREERNRLQEIILRQDESMNIKQGLMLDLQKEVTELQKKGQASKEDIDNLLSQIEAYQEEVERLQRENEQLISERNKFQQYIENKELVKSSTLDEKEFFEDQKDELKARLVVYETKIKKYEEKSGNASNSFQLYVNDKKNRRLLLDNVVIARKEIADQQLLLQIKFNYVWLAKSSFGRKVVIQLVRNGIVVEQSNEYTIDPETSLDKQMLINYFVNQSRHQIEGRYELDVLSRGESILTNRFRFTVE